MRTSLSTILPTTLQVLIVRAVRAKNSVYTSNFDKSMKLGTNALNLKSFFEGDTPKSHVIADVSTFLTEIEILKRPMYYISNKRKFCADHF